MAIIDKKLKTSNFIEKLQKFVILKGLIPSQYPYKLCSNILANTRGGYLTTETRKGEKKQ